MKPLGARVVEAFSAARKDVVVVAPFIKRKPLELLLDSVDESVQVTVYTRWLPDEVSRGVSDTSVLDVLASRGGATLFLLDRLHAKAYVADGRAFVGSANATGAGLGWASV